MTLLQRLLPGDEHASLLGDIQEEARHRSRLWYWWQLAAVLAVGSSRDARKHPLLAARAVTIGLGTLFIYVEAATIGSFWVMSNGGFYVGRFWLPSHAFAPYERLVFFTVAAVGFALSGWTVARASRSFGITMVLSYVRVICLLELILPIVLPIALRGMGRVVYTQLLVQIVLSVAWMVPLAGSVVAGAMLGMPRRSPRRT